MIFALLAVALRSAWRGPRRGRDALVHAISANLFLNGLWAVPWLAQRRPDRVPAETVPLWLSVLLLPALAARRDRAPAGCWCPATPWRPD